MTSYAAPMTSYAAPATYGGYAAPQMSYVPPMQGAYGQTAHPYLDENTIAQQKDQATTALKGQADMQQQMIDHQYQHQADIIDASVRATATWRRPSSTSRRCRPSRPWISSCSSRRCSSRWRSSSARWRSRSRRRR